MSTHEVASIKEYIDIRDSAVEQKIKLWIVTSVLAQFMLLLPLIFLLGGIYKNVTDTTVMIKSQQAALSDNELWRRNHEQWDYALTQWAKTKGFVEPDYTQRGK